MAKRWWPFGRQQTRASAVGGMELYTLGQPRWTELRYEALAREHFEQNAIVYRCARLIADAVASLPMYVRVDGQPVERHPLADVLRRPNPRQSGRDLLDAAVCYLVIAGEAFIEGVPIDFDRRLGELSAWRPDLTGVEPSADGLIAAYTYRTARGEKRIAAPEGGFSPVCHVRMFHPRDAYRGHSPLIAAARSVDENNEARRMTTALMQRGGRGAGALRYAPKGDASPALDANVRAALVRRLEEQFATRSGDRVPMVLNAALEWVEMGKTPSDLQAVELRGASAREVAFALGVPPLLLGLPGDNTYANFREANAAFYRQTVRPMAVRIAEALSAWVQPMHPGAEVVFDFDGDAAASFDRAEMWERAARANFLTVNERRALVGFEPIGDPEGAAIVVSAGDATLSDLTDPPEPEALDPQRAARLAYGGE